MMAESTLPALALNPRARGSISQLCTNLYIAAEKVPARVAVTSAERREGKTSIGLGLAIEAVQLLGVKVVFVEANLRAPSVGRHLGFSEAPAGLGNLLVGQSQLDGVIVTLGKDLPDVIPAGTITDEEVIGRCMKKQDLSNLFNTLGQRYQSVIVETAPINLYPESQIVVGLAERVLLVVRAGVTSREAAALAVKRIELSGSAEPLVVLNRKKFPLPEFLYKRL